MTIIKKFEPDEPKEGFPKKYIVITAAFLFAFVLVQIWANNTVLVYGEKFDRLSEAAKQLTLENQLLENQIAEYASLDNIASKSGQLGFSTPESIQYIR